MDQEGQHVYYFGNLPKKTTQMELRSYLAEYGNITNLEFRLDKENYCPTKIAYISFSYALAEETIAELNKKTFQEKRLFVNSTKSEKFFTPLLSVVVRYLNEHISEEDLYEYFQQVGSVQLVQKPAQNYAYVSFQDNNSIKEAIALKKSLKGIEPYIVEVKRSISVFLEKQKAFPYASIKEKCDKLQLLYDPASEYETTLLVTNIPRDTEEDEVIDLLARFGKIVDWQMLKSPTCVLSNNGYVTYQHPNMARNAFINGPLSFQGFGMDLYNQKIHYTLNDSDSTVIIRRTSVYLTNDEIFEKCSEYGKVLYIQRTDTVNYNTIVRLDSVKATNKVLYIPRIAGEDVQIRLYTAKQYTRTLQAPCLKERRVPPKRSRKVSKLMHINEIEERRNLVTLPTEFNRQYFNPNPQYYRNEVQIWNHAPKQTLVEFREFFKKCGNVINLRELKEQSTSPVGVVYLSFDTKLEAKRVCKLNHSFMCSRRLLILMADQSIVHDPQLCVNIWNLSEEITDEDVYDRFSMIGNVKYVFRPRVREAIVCMAKENWQVKALKVICVGRFHVTVGSLLSANDQQSTQPGSIMPNSVSFGINMTDVIIPQSGTRGTDQWCGAMNNVPMGGSMHLGSMGQRNGSWMLSVPTPMPTNMHMLMPTAMMRPGISGTGPVGLPGPIQMGGPHISPRMRGLMQAIEGKMIKSNNFSSLSMADQFHLVREIINQCLNFPAFLRLIVDQKIRYLINGQNGFRQVNTFTLFTYPEQQQMLSIIETYYRSTCDPGSIPAPGNNADINETNYTQSPNTLVVLTQKSADMTPWGAKDTDQTTSNDKDEDDDDAIPPAPSPPPISSLSASISPVSDGVRSPASCSPTNGSTQKRMYDNQVEIVPKKKKKENMPTSQRPFVYVSNLPKEVTEAHIIQVFRKYGKINFMSESKSRDPNVKAIIVKFETIYQAHNALDLHLTMLLGRLIRVMMYKGQYKARLEYAVTVTCTGSPYSENEVFETFKSCGRIGYIWTRKIHGSEACVIDFEDKISARAALKITYLHNGNRCKAVAFIPTTKPPT